MPSALRAALSSLPILFAIAACTPSGDWEPPVVQEISNPAASGARFPFPADNTGSGAAIWSWLEPENAPDLADKDTAAVTKLVWASFDGERWSSPELITRGEGIFVNWADFPALAGIADVPLTAHWLQRISGGAYAYHVNMAFRSAAGVWSPPIVPHADRSPTEHGFVSMVPLDNDRVLAIWLDGYRMQGGEEEGGSDSHQSHGGEADLSKAMTLRSVVVHADGSLGDEVEVDSAVCDCCQTSAARSGSRVIAVYRDRSDGEIRDIYRAVYDLDKAAWGQPLALSNEGWEITGCPVNGPQIAAWDNTVIAAWYSGADNQPRSYFAVSDDGGMTFGEPLALDEGTSTGRVGIAFNHRGMALVTWISSADSGALVYGRLWQSSGLSRPFVVGEIDASRASGFPRVSAAGVDFLVAWTQFDTADPPESDIKTVLVSPGES